MQSMPTPDKLPTWEHYLYYTSLHYHTQNSSAQNIVQTFIHTDIVASELTAALGILSPQHSSSTTHWANVYIYWLSTIRQRAHSREKVSKTINNDHEYNQDSVWSSMKLIHQRHAMSPVRHFFISLTQDKLLMMICNQHFVKWDLQIYFSGGQHNLVSTENERK